MGKNNKHMVGIWFFLFSPSLLSSFLFFFFFFFSEHSNGNWPSSLNSPLKTTTLGKHHAIFLHSDYAT